MKELIYNRVIITLDEQGAFVSGNLQYKVKENGEVGKGQKSIGISGSVSIPIINTEIDKIKETAKNAEGITV